MGATRKARSDLTHRQPLLWLAAAATCGVVASSVGGATLGWVIAAWVTVAILPWVRSTRRWALLVVLFAPVYAIRHRQCETAYRSASILQIADEDAQPVVIEGTVDRPVTLHRHPLHDAASRREVSPWQTRIELSLTRFRAGHDFRPCAGRVLVTCDGASDQLRPGDQLRVYGTLYRFLPATNPGQSDLRDVYRRRRLHARVQVASPDQMVITESVTRSVWRPVAAMACRSRDLLRRHVGEASGGLAVALVIGQRDDVDPDTRDLLVATGTAHLLSVSGMHLAIVVLLARWLTLLLPLPGAARFACLIGVCLLYVAITGARPPVVRAAVLVLAMILALWVRRPMQPINTLALAALLLMALNPELVFSVGTQLSFLAVATLLYCGRRDRQRTDHQSEAEARRRRLQALIDGSRAAPLRWSRALLAAVGQLAWYSLCVTAMSLPLVWYQFHIVSPISVMANVALSPLLLVALGSGVATVVGGSIADPLAIVPGILCDYSLRAMRGTISIAAELPGGHFWMPSPPAGWVILFYVVIAGSLLLTGARASRARYLWIVIWVTSASWVATRPAQLPPATIEATFVDVGHGTSVVLRFGRDDVWLYDCGWMGNDRGSSRDIEDVLWSLGVRRLNGIILSHADSDHYNALPGLLRRFEIGRIVTPPGMLDEPEGALAATRRAIAREAVPTFQASRGDRSLRRETSLTVLHPPARRLPGSDNANSLVLRIDHGVRTLLLPGDLEPPGTAALIAQPRLPAGGILMAPHHGSLAIDAEPFLAWSRPRETIVSGGTRARRPEVADRLAVTGSEIHVTAGSGAIRVRIGPRGKVTVRRWLEAPW